MRDTLVDELHTPLETFNEAALHCKKVILGYYREELPDDLLHAAISMWFSLKLQHRTSKIIHLVNPMGDISKRLRCLLCNDCNPEYVVEYHHHIASSRVLPVAATIVIVISFVTELVSQSVS